MHPRNPKRFTDISSLNKHQSTQQQATYNYPNLHGKETEGHRLNNCWKVTSVQFNQVAQSCLTLSCVTPCAAARQASLSIINSPSLPKLISIELLMPSNNLILCHPLLLLPSIFPSIRVFSNVSSLHQVAKVLELQFQH